MKTNLKDQFVILIKANLRDRFVNFIKTNLRDQFANFTNTNMTEIGAYRILEGFDDCSDYDSAIDPFQK
jgi:hypothetical protein